MSEQWQKWEKSNVVKMHQEDKQVNIVIGLTVPASKRNAVDGLLESALNTMKASLSSAYGKRLAEMGVSIDDLRIEWE
jgi:hypothetical protein